MDMQDRKFNSDGAAEYLGIRPATLKTWRCTRKVQIPFVKIGDRVVYRQVDLDRFLDANTVQVEAGV